MNRLRLVIESLLLSVLSLGVAACTGVGNATGDHSSSLKGSVSLMGKPVDGAAITLWQASGGKEPKQLKTLSSGKDGAFSISISPEEGAVHYLVATGGRVNGEEAKRLSMLSVLDDEVAESVSPDERTSAESPRPVSPTQSGIQLSYLSPTNISGSITSLMAATTDTTPNSTV